MRAVAGPRRALLVLLAAAVGAATSAPLAAAGHGPLPWATGPDVDSPIETAAAEAVSASIVGRPVRVRCHSEQEWVAANAPFGWDAARIAGFASIGGAVAELSPATCFHLDEFWNGGATEKRCRVAAADFGRVLVERKKTRVRTPAAQRARVVVDKILREANEYANATADRLVRCADYPQRTHAVHTLAHEAFHLAGTVEEAEADCYALQLLVPVAMRLGARQTFAGGMAAWMWSWYETHQASKPPEYSSPECGPDRGLDLTPGDGRWP